MQGAEAGDEEAAGGRVDLYHAAESGDSGDAVAPPDRGRGGSFQDSVPEKEIQQRLAEARNELNQMQDYKYALVNDVLEQAVTELRAIVLCERGVRRRRPGHRVELQDRYCFAEVEGCTNYV